MFGKFRFIGGGSSRERLGRLGRLFKGSFNSCEKQFKSKLNTKYNNVLLKVRILQIGFMNCVGFNWWRRLFQRFGIKYFSRNSYVITKSNSIQEKKLYASTGAVSEQANIFGVNYNHKRITHSTCSSSR